MLEALSWPGVVPDDVTCTDDHVDGRHLRQYGLEGYQIRADVGYQTNSHIGHLKRIAEMLAVILLS